MPASFLGNSPTGTNAKYDGPPVMTVDGKGNPVALAGGFVYDYDFYDATLAQGLVALDAGAATEAVVTSVPHGVWAFTLTTEDLAQTARVSSNDILIFQPNRGLIVNWRVKPTVLPTIGTEHSHMVIGLASATNAAVDSITQSMWFRLDSSNSNDGSIGVETDDGTTDSGLLDTGLVANTTDWLNLRIDCTDITSVKFYVNDQRVLSSTTFNMSLWTAGAQPYAGCGKTKTSANTAVGTLQIDRLSAVQHGRM